MTPWTLHSMKFSRPELEWVAFPFSRGSSQPRDRAQISHIVGGFFTVGVSGEAPRGRGWRFQEQSCCALTEEGISESPLAGLRLPLAQKSGGKPQGGGRDPPCDHTPQHPLLHPGQFGPSRPRDRVSHRKVAEATLALGVPGPPPRLQKRPQ